jgi:hypothetical protein
MENVIWLELVVNHRPKGIQKGVRQIDIVVDGLVQGNVEAYLFAYLLHFVVKPVIFRSRDITIDCLEDRLGSLVIKEMYFLAVVNHFI